MNAASSLAFPGSKTLAAWWRQLASFAPRTLWVGHLLVHHVEALADVDKPTPLERLQRFILDALVLEASQSTRQNQNEPALVARLERRLGIDAGILIGLLHQLQQLGLLRRVGGSWSLSDAGAEARHQGSFLHRAPERRQFSFVERAGPDGTRLAPPHYVVMPTGVGVAWQPAEQDRFDVAWLQDACARDATWKAAFDFPEDVAAVQPTVASHADWQRVLIDRPERVLTTLVVTREGHILGFPARLEGWQLSPHRPLFTLSPQANNEDRGEKHIFPDLAQPPDNVVWSSAWRAWCAGKNLDPVQAAECQVRLDGVRLVVSAPSSLQRTLLAGKSDVKKGDAWLLAGPGYFRQAAQIVLGDPAA